MKLFGTKISYYIMTCVLLNITLMLTACAEKAKVIQAGAVQFEEESLVAIEKMDELRRKEIETVPLPSDKASKFFVDGVKNSTQPITLEKLHLLINPFKTETPKSEAEWQAFLQKLREQYTTFAATFEALDKGWLFAASDVNQAIPILNKLIVQMAAFAKSINNNPAEFIRERAAIAAELEEVRDTKPYDNITDLKLLELERRLREVVAKEEKITRDTITQALKAVTLGVELRRLLEDYDKLSLDDISDGLYYAFKLVGDVYGLNLSGLEAKLGNIVGVINTDESLSKLFDIALSEINKTREQHSF